MAKAFIYTYYPCPDIQDFFGFQILESGYAFDDLSARNHAKFKLSVHPEMEGMVKAYSLEEGFLTSRVAPKAEEYGVNVYGYEIEVDNSEIWNDEDELPPAILKPLHKYLRQQLPHISTKFDMSDLPDRVTISDLVYYIEIKMKLRSTTHKILRAFGIKAYATMDNLVVTDPSIIKKGHETQLYRAEFPLVSPSFKHASAFLDSYFAIKTGEGVRTRLRAFKYDSNLRTSFVNHLRHYYPNFELSDLDAYLDKRFLRLPFNKSAPSDVILPVPQDLISLREFIPVDASDTPLNLAAAIDSCKKNGRFLEFLIHPQTGQRIITKKLSSEYSESIRAEHEAYEIYRAFGVTVPQSAIVENENGQPVLVLQYLEGITLGDYINDINNSYIQDYELIQHNLTKNWPIDALLGNPDTGYFHDNNIMITTGGLYRIDMGFALGYLPNGALKSTDHTFVGKFKWDNRVRDFYEMRFHYCASSLYGGITNAQIFERLQQAQRDLPKVKKVASSTNYGFIARRLHNALQHFGKLVQMEQQFRENADSITTPKSTPVEVEPKAVRKYNHT